MASMARLYEELKAAGKLNDAFKDVPVDHALLHGSVFIPLSVYGREPPPLDEEERKNYDRNRRKKGVSPVSSDDRRRGGARAAEGTLLKAQHVNLSVLEYIISTSGTETQKAEMGECVGWAELTMRRLYSKDEANALAKPTHNGKELDDNIDVRTLPNGERVVFPPPGGELVLKKFKPFWDKMKPVLGLKRAYENAMEARNEDKDGLFKYSKKYGPQTGQISEGAVAMPPIYKKKKKPDPAEEEERKKEESRKGFLQALSVSIETSAPLVGLPMTHTWN